jgi:hypothetical protein
MTQRIHKGALQNVKGFTNVCNKQFFSSPFDDVILIFFHLFSPLLFSLVDFSHFLSPSAFSRKILLFRTFARRLKALMMPLEIKREIR